jgi:hypothetical protein
MVDSERKWPAFNLHFSFFNSHFAVPSADCSLTDATSSAGSPLDAGVPAACPLDDGSGVGRPANAPEAGCISCPGQQRPAARSARRQPPGAENLSAPLQTLQTPDGGRFPQLFDCLGLTKTRNSVSDFQIRTAHTPHVGANPCQTSTCVYLKRCHYQ